MIVVSQQRSLVCRDGTKPVPFHAIVKSTDLIFFFWFVERNPPTLFLAVAPGRSPRIRLAYTQAAVRNNCYT